MLGEKYRCDGGRIGKEYSQHSHGNMNIEREACAPIKSMIDYV